jgi:cytochrome c556
MKKSFLAAVIALAVAAPAYFAFAADDFAFKSQIEGRQAFMQLYRFNISILGGMARGDVEYDAAAASAAANNLLVASKMDNGAMWPMGSHTEAPGLADVTAAKETAWSSYPNIAEKGKDLTEALTTMAAVAGDGLEPLRSNMGAVGNGCKGCHKNYRLSRD